MGALAAGAALSAIGLGVKAIADKRVANANARLAQEANQRSNIEAMQIAQQTKNFQTQQQQAQQAMADRSRLELEQKRQQMADKIAPLSDTALKGLGTIYTSPLGDTSEPALGRRKLLGN